MKKNVIAGNWKMNKTNAEGVAFINELKAIDTKEIWQYGAYTAIGSLDLMCTCMDVPSPKEGEVTGAKVHDAYWNKGMLNEIAEYCERDVQVLIDVVQKLKALV